MRATYSHPINAGAIYFALIFALGFLLGTVRVLWLVPATGETVAVLIEQPIMLTASWFAAGWLVRRHGVVTTGERAAMGAVALMLLFIAEPLLAYTLFGHLPQDWVKGVFTMPGPIGLAGQLLFGMMPLVVPTHKRT